MKKIAVIGTGIMGSGIASNFLKKGYEVFVWNRSADKLKSLLDQGGVSCGTPQEACQKAEMIFEVTANDASSRSVWLGAEGILAGADPNKILITSATLSIAWTDELAKQCETKGYTYFDMAMTGSRVAAETGKLILLVGGDETKLESFKPDLSAISEKVIYFGKAGSGMRYKLLLNMLQGIHIVALGEVLKIAESIGLDVTKVGNALAERPGGTTTNVAWRNYQHDPQPINFSVEWITKDLTYAKELAASVPTPLLDQVIKKYLAASAQGFSQEEWTKVMKL